MPLRRFATVAVVVVLACLSGLPSGAARAQEAAADERFEIPGAFSIALPDEGYAWRVAREVQDEEGRIAGRYLVCSSPESSASIILTVEHRTAETDPQRRATLAAYYNAAVQALADAGFSDLDATQPELEPPIPQAVTYAISGRPPGEDDQRRYFAVQVVFGRSIYNLQAVATTQRLAEQLRDVANTIEEPAAPVTQPAGAER